MTRCQTWRKTNDVVVSQNENEGHGSIVMRIDILGPEAADGMFDCRTRSS